jgi:mercuric ion binding protein
MKKSIIVAGGAFALATAGIISTTYAPLAAQTTKTSTRTQTATFAIENMTCALCPVTVKKAMEGVSGVRSVRVDFKAKSATVVFDASVATVAAIARASTSAGYPARVAS